MSCKNCIWDRDERFGHGPTSWWNVQAFWKLFPLDQSPNTPSSLSFLYTNHGYFTQFNKRNEIVSKN